MAYEQGDRRRKIQEVIGLMQKNLECSICLEMMNNPVSTNCGHQFCRFCLMEFLERKKQVPCPLCKKMITKRSLMDRSQLGQMVENVRNLITAFQADTGLLFSPPRGPQLTDLIPCTPDTIQAKTVTEVNGKSTASLDKKTGKQRNVRISRRKTLDNAEINVSGDQEQTSSSRMSDSGTGLSVALVDKRLASRKTRKTVSSSRELLQCIENGVHHRTDTSRLTGTTENIQPIDADNSSYHDIENSTSVTCDGLHSKHIEKSRMDDLCEQNSRVQTSVSDAVESQLSKDKENSCESNTLETVENCGAVHESIKEGEAVLFQTPLPLNSVEKLKRLPDQVDNSNKTARNLRSREKISNTIEENDSIACREQLTPDDFNDNETSGFEENKPIGDVKTYSKRGSIKQDKEANKKVKDWLKSVEVTEEKKDMQNVVGSKVTRKKQNLTKKDLKVKAEEEKMGLKMKHLAENITSGKTEETDYCFGFDDNAEDKESTALQEDKDERQTDDKSHEDIDMTIDQETPKGKVELLEKDDNLDHISDNQEHVHETKKTSSATISPESCVNKSAKPTLLNKKHIFKAKLTNKDNVVRESFIVDSKIENEVNEVKNATNFCEGAENRLSADQDLPDSDPYEFKSSGNTPRKPGKKKGKTSKAGAKKKNSKHAKLSEKIVGSVKSKSSKGNQNTKSNVICIEDKPISCTQEEIKKISSKLNQAEDYDLLTCTQEAVDSLEKDGIDLNNENYVAYPIETEVMDIKEQNGEMKSKASHQKKVRFKEPLLSDFRHDGKIDILGYRKAKEKMNKSDSSACDDNVKCISEVEHDNQLGVEVPKLEEGQNGEEDRIQNTAIRNEDIMDKDDSHYLGSVKENDHQEKRIDKVDTSSSYVDGKSAIQIDKAMDRTTPIKNVDSPARVYKNPMMTPTILKRSPGAKIMEENDTVEDEINSSGTDDLDINPEEDQFEEPVLEIQPDDIKEKLSSQELFVRNVLSSPQDGARQRPSPQIIEETPMVFSVPSKNKFKKLKSDKSSKSETHHDKNILTVSETPMITISDSMSQPLNKPLSEEQSENIELDPKEPSEGFKDSPKSTFDKDKVKDWTESDETQPPSDIDTALPSSLKHSKSPVVSHSVATNQEADINHEVESSVENSISLLNQYDNDVNVAANCKTNNDDENVESIVDEIENVPKSKKKRKSFMLQEEENYNASPLSVTSPVPTSTAEPVPKKKKLSRSAKKSNTKTSKTDLSQVGSMDVVTISESVQSEINTVDTHSLTEQDAAESQASCVPQTNSEAIVCENPQITSKKIMIEDSMEACYEDKLDDERNETLSKNTQRISQRENICMVPETEMINCSDTPVTSSLNVVADIEESQCQKTKEQENTHLEHDTNHNENVSTTFETDKSQEDQNRMKKSQTTRKMKTSRKKNSQKKNGLPKTKEHKQRHLSGMLVSPEENIIYSGGKGLPEDIFNMDSELPFVDNSPLDGVNQSESVLEKEETVTNNMLSEHAESVEDPASSGNRTKMSKTEKETVGRRYKSKKSANNDIDEAKHSKPDSDSESDLSQQVRKQKRLSGVKGARGLASRKKQSSSSKSASPFSPVSINPSETKSRKHTHSSPTMNGSEISPQKEITESSVIDITDSHENQNNDNSTLHVDNVDIEPVNDLPDLSQRFSQKKSHNNDADDNTVNSAISHVEESETVLVDSAIEIDHEKQEDPENNELDDTKSIEKANEMKAIENYVDSTSSEFELSSSSEQNCVKKNESDAIDKCIREAKDKISDIEQTLSEIVDKGSDNESCLSSQESKSSEVGKHKMNSKAAEYYQNINTSSPLPDLNTDEPMEVLESDIEPDDAHLNKNGGTKDRNNDSDDGHMKDRPIERESDSDEGPVAKKKSRKAVIADSSDDEDMSHHMNMTSSSAFSSQSENLTTQDRHALEKDLERMAREMEALKAQLNRGRSGGAANRSSADYTGQSQKGEMQVVAVEDSSDIDELIEMDDSVTEHSDNDMFLSPPPLALSQHDNSKQDIDQEVTSQPDKSIKPSPIVSQRKELRPALADLDINRPLSPGRKTPKVFVATGLTLHQVQETKKLASLNDCKFFTKFNESVTHVIVKPSKEREYLCDRTLKLFQGIANKCWIVNYYWVMDSRHAGHLVPEGPYEIQGDTANGEQHQGPMKSRMSSTNLFEKFSFMCVGDCPGLTVDDMTSLIQTCGGTVVSDVDCLRSTDRTPLIVTCSDVEDEDGDVQVSSQDIAMFNKHYKSHQVVTVSREWVLDSLTLYQLQPLKEYVVTSVKNMMVPKIA